MNIDDFLVRGFAALVIGAIVLGRVHKSSSPRPYADVDFRAAEASAVAEQTTRRTYRGPKAPSAVIASQSAEERRMREEFENTKARVADRSAYRSEFDAEGRKRVERLNRDWRKDYAVKEQDT